MTYSKTFYYRLAIVIDGKDKLTGVNEKNVMEQITWFLGGVRKIKINEQEVTLRPVAVDLIPKVQTHSFDGCLERLNKIVERLESNICPKCSGEE